MTEKTDSLINELAVIVDKNKYLLLEGGVAVGKTYIAKEIARQLENAQYNSHGIEPEGGNNYEVISELISVHPSLFYEDFIFGISATARNGHLDFRFQDKIFIAFVKAAMCSFEHNEPKKYVLIIDDINRGYLPGILGEAMSLIEPHGDSNYSISIGDGSTVYLPPNFYIIATQNTVVDQVAQNSFSLARHFYTYHINSDYKYMDDNANPIVFNQYSLDGNYIYNRVKRIVIDNISQRSANSMAQDEEYILGHGLFANANMAARIKHQIIPLLKTYMKDGILEKSALPSINSLERFISGQYIKEQSACSNYISIRSNIITKDIFIQENTSNKPLKNLVYRIVQQGLLSHEEILSNIFFNPNVIVRKQGHYNGANIIYNPEGYLFVKKERVSEYRYGTSRLLYNRTDPILIAGEEYTIAGEMQPTEYNNWDEQYLEDNYRNERNSTSPNTILFFIIKNYYKTIDKKLNEYMDNNPEDDNLSLMRLYIAEEWRSFVEKYKLIYPEPSSNSSEKNERNRQANDEVRKIIAELTLLWKNIGESIEWAGRQIIVEGVYKVENVSAHREYLETMNNLDIHQMILQGPPGTSKTYSSKAMLRFAGKGIENDEYLSEDELADFQIKDYEDDDIICKYHIDHPDESMKICWDIVQFHPSYGYEDFVRGIEVSTVPGDESESSQISYDTVDKILGKMAKVALRFPGTSFYLIVDEINRANLATVFGELIYGLEYREEPVSTPYIVADSNKISLPKNMYIVGTMNTADKSIGSIDYAIRRRFLFFPLLPNKEVIEKYRMDIISEEEKPGQEAVNNKALRLFRVISRLFNGDTLNSEYYKEDIQIGHTYFLVKSEEELYLRFKYQILPILREYYKDGMFQLQIGEGDDYMTALLQIIAGTISISDNDEYLQSIFGSLISAEDEAETNNEQA